MAVTGLTAGELIEKLQKVPPSTLVCTDDNESPISADVDVYVQRMVVERTEYSIWVSRDDERSHVEPVVIITMFGQDDDAVQL